MKKVNHEKYVEAVNGLKQRYARLVTNNFVLSDNFKEMLDAGGCLQFESDGCVFAAVPKHNAFYQLYYHAAGEDRITEGLSLIEEQYDKRIPLACTVIGKQARVEVTVPFFYDKGYALRKRTQRFDHLKYDMLRIKKEDTTAEFARAEDAEEILEMLKSHFDIYSEQVPTLSEIRQNADKEQIIIVRCDNKIAAFWYFEIEQNIYSGIFEYTRPEYRKSMVYLELPVFLKKVFEEKGIELNRAYGWRDMDNKKLNRVSNMLGAVPLDVVLYTMINSFGMDI